VIDLGPPNPQDQRTRPRTRMDLRVRIRRTGPPRESVEVTSAVDVSRNGLLFVSREPHELNSVVWVTMPYTPDSPHNPPEFPASVVRLGWCADGTSQVAVEFHSAHADRFRSTYAAEETVKSAIERRGKNRVRMTLPIRVRYDGRVEVSVTLDVSRSGVLFRSTRDYDRGQKVWVSMPYQPAEPPREVLARVVRIIERANVRGVALQYWHQRLEF
jgi:hypothetical protein